MTPRGKLSDNVKIDYVYDADGAFDGTSGTMLDMLGYDGCLVLVLGAATTASATHHLTGFKIVSNSASDGSGTDHDIAEAVTAESGTTKSLTPAGFGTSAHTSHGDQMLALDIKSEHIYAGDRYIGAVLTKTGTFTCTVVYIRYRGTNSFKDMFQTTRTAFQYTGNL